MHQCAMKSIMIKFCAFITSKAWLKSNIHSVKLLECTRKLFLRNYPQFWDIHKWDLHRSSSNTIEKQMTYFMNVPNIDSNNKISAKAGPWFLESTKWNIKKRIWRIFTNNLTKNRDKKSLCSCYFLLPDFGEDPGTSN